MTCRRESTRLAPASGPVPAHIRLAEIDLGFAASRMAVLTCHGVLLVRTGCVPEPKPGSDQRRRSIQVAVAPLARHGLWSGIAAVGMHAKQGSDWSAPVSTDRVVRIQM